MAGRPKCDLRNRLEALLSVHPPKIAREITYTEALLDYCKKHPEDPICDILGAKNRLRNHIRVLQHKILNDREVGT